MTLVYRIFRQTDRGSQVIAEVRGTRVTGLFADLIRERLVAVGYPQLPVDEALRRFHTYNPRYFGFECVDEPEE